MKFKPDMDKLMARHGDIDLFYSDTKPQEFIGSGEKKKEIKLALGEVTGHSHRLSVENPEDLIVYEWDNKLGVRFHLKASGTLTHEEHDSVTLPPGFYTKKIEREYDPFQNIERQVID